MKNNYFSQTIELNKFNWKKYENYTRPWRSNTGTGSLHNTVCIITTFASDNIKNVLEHFHQHNANQAFYGMPWRGKLIMLNLPIQKSFVSDKKIYREGSIFFTF